MATKICMSLHGHTELDVYLVSLGQRAERLKYPLNLLYIFVICIRIEDLLAIPSHVQHNIQHSQIWFT